MIGIKDSVEISETEFVFELAYDDDPNFEGRVEAVEDDFTDFSIPSLFVATLNKTSFTYFEFKFLRIGGFYNLHNLNETSAN